MQTKLKIEELPLAFEGEGDMRWVTFTQIAKSPAAYIYKLTAKNDAWYEVILRKTVAKVINFEKRIYSETDFKEVYPKTKDFGIELWATRIYARALFRFNEINQTQELNQLADAGKMVD